MITVIDITFIFDIVFHMVAISTFNKGDDLCLKRLWHFWWYCWYTKRRYWAAQKREWLKSAIGSAKSYLLGSKWTQERVEKASYETMNKLYAEYRQRELNEKGEKTENALGKHVINLYSTGISRWLKIKDVKKLRQDI